MPFHFLSLKELAMRVVLQEDVPFQALPQEFPLRRVLDKLSIFPGDYKLIETRPHPVARRSPMLGEDHFARSWVWAGYI